MVRVISLGSSFAAGPGIDPQSNLDAGRSFNNYPNLFARKLGLDPTDTSQFLDLTVSGATLLNVNTDPQTAGNTTFPPQLDSLPPVQDGDDGSDLVITITGGGNDMFYIGSMFAWTLKHTLWGKLVTWLLMRREEREWLEQPTVATPEQVSQRFAFLLDSLRQRYPKAKIYLVEYFAMIGPDTVAGKDVGWDQQQIQRYEETAELLQKLYKQAAGDRRGVHVVPLAEVSKKHALGSPEPWVSDGSLLNFYRHGAYHPNLRGMQAASEILLDFHEKLQSQDKCP
ncbi:SGNH hydrolase-type esterase domain protein [Kalmanozyma brasiliensis GHG001]|uniref:SGNH hydrolase-type esterase domain-containing protein n=1 Tax=Kalmanozyma brasiliensis (strain GHG001) TaxID=1365824 RepID=V5GFN7_KALBG|nr:SGNH hydrolase-type esterase domain protein [Kalmanozyma brasiliensis GHG001]EST04842.1 SGNH hydrolase-type esterase domain protein [Kalmanozyma brasiliensis GHG001]